MLLSLTGVSDTSVTVFPQPVVISAAARAIDIVL